MRLRIESNIIFKNYWLAISLKVILRQLQEDPSRGAKSSAKENPIRIKKNVLMGKKLHVAVSGRTWGGGAFWGSASEPVFGAYPLRGPFSGTPIAIALAPMVG